GIRDLYVTGVQTCALPICLTAAPSNFHRLLTCGQCGGDFCHTGRERYGCVEHYRRKSCSNGRTVRRRAMEKAVRDVLDEAAAQIDRKSTRLNSSHVEISYA